MGSPDDGSSSYGETLHTPGVEGSESPLGQHDKASNPETAFYGAEGNGLAQEDSEELLAFGPLSDTQSNSAVADERHGEQGGGQYKRR